MSIYLCVKFKGVTLYGFLDNKANVSMLINGWTDGHHYNIRFTFTFYSSFVKAIIVIQT